MADDNSSIFTEKATERLRSPDDLDEYVRVTNPSVWVVLGACAILMIGLFAWGFFGTAETSVGAMGTRVGDEVLCFVPPDDISNVHEGEDVMVDGVPMSVGAVSAVPVSREETHEIVGGDYLTSALVGDGWAYVVRINGDAAASLPEGVPLSVTITTERVAPISLIFRDEAHA